MDKKDLLARAADIAYLIRQWNEGDDSPACEDAVLIAPDVMDALLDENARLKKKLDKMQAV